ncbi:Zn2/Cys6 DNA-binding protein [Ilyonectria robusta]
MFFRNTPVLLPRPGRSRLGCEQCKQRHIRCDRISPECSQCIAKGIKCPGYKPHPLKWVVATPAQQQSKGNNENRRSPPAASTAQQQKFRSGKGPPPAPPPLSDKLENYPPNELLHKTQALPVDKRFSSPKLVPPLSEDDFRHQFFIQHYFTWVAPIMTIFDGDRNPFGSNLKDMISQHKSLYYAISSIGAIHMAQADSVGGAAAKDCALRFRISAYRLLRRDLVLLHTETDLFITVLLLAITESWFDATTCGIPHLEAAKWIMLKRQEAKDPLPAAVVHALYWLETLVSFVSDYNGHAVLLKKVEAKLDLDHSSTTYHQDNAALASEEQVDPMLGTWKTLFPHLAALAILTRRSLKGQSMAENYSLAEMIETQLLEWEPSSLDMLPRPRTDSFSLEELARQNQVLVEDETASSTAVFDSPVSESDAISVVISSEHTYTAYMAEAFRQASLLTLYHHFPELLAKRTSWSPTGPRRFLDHLAHSIVSLMRQVPLDNRIWFVCAFPVFTAAQRLNKSEDREFMRQIFRMLTKRVGLYHLTIAIKLLEQMWDNVDNDTHTSWINILYNQGVEMLIN